MSNVANQLSRLTTPDAYQADRANIFPSKTSLQWFMRSRRELLVAAKAVLVPTGRVMIDPVAFDGVVLAVGAQKAQALSVATPA